MAEDWRVAVEFEDPDHLGRLSEELESHIVEDDVRAAFGDRIVVSNDGDRLFLYADTRSAAEAAAAEVRSTVAGNGWPTRINLERWHEDAEDWEPAGTPAADSAEARHAEHLRLMAREDAETKAQGYADWEVRVELPDHRAAHELSARLDREGVPHVRRWKYVLVGARDEDAAKAWAERLRTEAAAGSDISVEGTFESVAAHNPWAVWSEAGGGP
jgi:hypothetical protein